MLSEYRKYAEDRVNSCKLRLRIMESSQERHVRLHGSPSEEFERQIQLLNQSIQKWEDVLKL